MISKLISESEDYLVFYKPSGIPTVPLKNQDADTLTLLGVVASAYPEVLEVTGRNPWEGSAIHRLDTPTSGLVLFARNQKSYDYLQNLQINDLFIKYYRVNTVQKDCNLEGFPKYPFENPSVASCLVISSEFRPYGKKGASVRPVTDSSKYHHTGRIYSTYVENESENVFICSLKRGFRHQIRCHMAWSGHAIVGDVLYGADRSDVFGLEAIGLSFPEKDGREIVFGTISQHRIR